MPWTSVPVIARSRSTIRAGAKIQAYQTHTNPAASNPTGSKLPIGANGPGRAMAR
jgi:hypothetical protein